MAVFGGVWQTPSVFHIRKRGTRPGPLSVVRTPDGNFSANRVRSAERTSSGADQFCELGSFRRASFTAGVDGPVTSASIRASGANWVRSAKTLLRWEDAPRIGFVPQNDSPTGHSLDIGFVPQNAPAPSGNSGTNWVCSAEQPSSVTDRLYELGSFRRTSLTAGDRDPGPFDVDRSLRRELGSFRRMALVPGSKPAGELGSSGRTARLASYPISLSLSHLGSMCQLRMH
ncbi:MAG: hypothetical protein JWO38_4439 [Gemmataceae bacterium]|nr:hypothetical protein [Gemmataceae bacterium]